MALDNIDELNVKHASPFPTALRYGAIAGLLLIVVGIVQYLLGMTSGTSKAIGWLSMLIAIVFPVLVIRDHRDNDLNGFISYGRGLGVGTLTSLIMSILSILWVLILFGLIDTSLPDMLLDAEIGKMEETGMSDEEIETAVEISRPLMLPILATFSFLIPFVIGFVTSLIAAAVSKRDKSMS